jgi:plastocyanin
MITVGDTVEWVHDLGIHTVTSGTGPTDPDVGMLFDDPLTAGNPLVTYTFTDAGEFDYFCTPHFGVGMIGIVRVTPPIGADEPVRAFSWSRLKGLYR